ncbi:MAG: AmmeMemoRadiSam system protein A, partial [Eggerthellaceae bacterium]|nr:AmmeMemoRadiSam system protein A [Eggerthellaceae bacterium]
MVDPHVALARLSVETYVKTGRAAVLPDDVSPELLERRAGVFVSLHEHGELRGCIGTISATTGSIAEEIIQNGISACSRDPRFPAVRPDELDYLEYSVDVLGDAERIESPDQLDVKRYGVIVTKGWKRGLLLPNLDGVDTIGYQLAIAKQKAGIDPADDEDR